MLEIGLVQGFLLKNVFESIREFVNDANINFSATGFSLQGIDSSHVALVAVLLRSEGFKYYRCDHDISKGIIVNSMSNLLQCAGDDDIIGIMINDASDTVTFLFENPTRHQIFDFQMNFGMKVTEINSEHLAIPDAKYHATLRMPSIDLARIFEFLTCIGDTVVISANEGVVKFSPRGDNGGTPDVVCEQYINVDKPEESIVIETIEPVCLTFETRYMNTFVKATSLSNTVIFYLSNDLPVLVEYKVAEMGHVRFYIAPKIEEDEEDTKPQV